MFNMSRFRRRAAASDMAGALTLILIAFLVLLGCPSGTGSSATDQGAANDDKTSGVTPSIPIPTPAEKAGDLADDLEEIFKNNDDVDVNVVGATTTITVDASTGTTTVSELPPVDSGVTLIIEGDTLTLSGTDATLTVKAGGTAKVTGGLEVASDAAVEVKTDAKVEVAGEITVAGTVNVAPDAAVEVASGGVYDVTNTGTSGTNYGTITVAAGGTIKAGGANNVTGTGFHVVQAGGEAYYKFPGDSDYTLLVGSSSSSGTPVV